MKMLAALIWDEESTSCEHLFKSVKLKRRKPVERIHEFYVEIVLCSGHQIIEGQEPPKSFSSVCVCFSVAHFPQWIRFVRTLLIQNSATTRKKTAVNTWACLANMQQKKTRLKWLSGRITSPSNIWSSKRFSFFFLNNFVFCWYGMPRQSKLFKLSLRFNYMFIGKIRSVINKK